MTVFITQNRSNLDFSMLLKFSPQHVFFYKRSIYPDESDVVMSDSVGKIKNLLERYHFNPSEDYIALVGDPVLIAACVSTAHAVAAGVPIKLLKFDRQANDYYEVILPNPFVRSPTQPVLNSVWRNNI